MSEQTIGPKSKKQEMFINSEADITVFGGAAGAGKALSHGTPVLTKTGWKKIEDLRVGDVVVSPKGNFETVTGVFPQGVVRLLTVTMADGASTTCCEDHLWVVHQRCNKFARRLVDTKTLKTLVQKEHDKAPSQKKRHYSLDLCVPLPLKDEQVALPLHPYLVGCLLGDGGLAHTYTKITSADPDILSYIESLGYAVSKNSDKYQYGILGIKQKTQDLGLRVTCEHKAVPDAYKNASIEARYELVRGLLDTDGTVKANGQICFVSTSVQLAKDVQYLIRSLGGTAKLSTFKPTCQSGAECKVAYSVYIRHPDGRSLFNLPRKRERVKPQTRVIGHQIKSVVDVGYGEATCISISGEDKLFITKDFMVTHNTHLGVMDFGKYIQYPRFRAIITRRTTPQLKGPGGVYDKARHMFKMFDPKVEWKEKEGKFVFSSGAEVYLKHFENEDARQNFDGAEVNEFLVDEGQQFSGDMVTYLMSRMRNPACPEVKPHMKITCNPLKTSFLRKWVDWYLFQEGEFKGRPDPAKDGVIRWFVLKDGDVVFADTREELIKRFGEKTRPLSFTFISANVK